MNALVKYILVIVAVILLYATTSENIIIFKENDSFFDAHLYFDVNPSKQFARR